MTRGKTKACYTQHNNFKDFVLLHVFYVANCHLKARLLELYNSNSATVK